MLEALTSKFTMCSQPEVDLRRVASLCPAHATGADLYALAAAAWMHAVRRQLVRVEGVEAASLCDVAVVVTHADLEAAAVELRPSLSAADVAKYERLRMQYM